LLPQRRRPARHPRRRGHAGPDRTAVGPHAVQQLAGGGQPRVAAVPAGIDGVAADHRTAAAGAAMATMLSALPLSRPWPLPRTMPVRAPVPRAGPLHSPAPASAATAA